MGRENSQATWDFRSEFISAGRAVDVIYMDFSKAFDKVPHGRLMKKVSKDVWDRRKVGRLDR